MGKVKKEEVRVGFKTMMTAAQALEAQKKGLTVKRHGDMGSRDDWYIVDVSIGRSNAGST